MELNDEQLEHIRDEARRVNVGSITLHVNAYTGKVELVVQQKRKLPEANRSIHEDKHRDA